MDKTNNHTCGCAHEHHGSKACHCAHEHHERDHGAGCGCTHESHHKAHHDANCNCGHHELHRNTGCGCGHDHHEHHHNANCTCDHHEHDHDTGCGCGHDHTHEPDPEEARRELIILGAGAVLLAAGILIGKTVGTVLLLSAFVLLAWDIVLGAVRNIRGKNIFGENLLMTIAGIGAVCINEIPEGILVFLLYRLGEYLQTRAVSSSRRSISALLDVRPDRANLLLDGQVTEVMAEDISVGQVILIRPGEKIPLDGTVISGISQIDTAALTGESIPREVSAGHTVMAGCINLSGALEVRAEKSFGESTASKILEMVEHASEKKAVREKFITRFARVYTPIVVALAAAVALIPPLVGWMHWGESFYSALCFLAISCPCALVISVPLSFFAGIGRASREGILVKGGNYLESMAQAEIVAFDKTGTLTYGTFSVHKCIPQAGYTEEELLKTAAAAESLSNHPIARSICAACPDGASFGTVAEYRENSGKGVSALCDEKLILAGQASHLTEAGIDFKQLPGHDTTTVYVAANGVYIGAILLKDIPKSDALDAVLGLRALGIKKTAMLSGDSKLVAEEIGNELGLDLALGELLPEDKLHAMEKLRRELTEKGKLLYAGDGINDTPVLAAADIGIAMGGLGADAAIETADVIVMGDEPGKIVSGIRIARRTRRIATENIIFSITVKALVMLLSVFGHVDLWMAVLADVGVCMLCVLNTLRIGRKME